MKGSSSLSLRMARVLMLASLCGLCVFAVLHHAVNAEIERYLNNSDFLSARTDARVRSLQEYVDTHGLASTDTVALRRWCRSQPLLLMELFRDGRLLFNSSYSGEDDLSEREIEAYRYDWFSYHTIDFSDGAAELLIICDDAYLFCLWATAAEAAFCVLIVFLIFLSEVRRVTRYISQLNREVGMMEGGMLDQPVTIRGTDELSTLARGLDSMRLTFLEQREAEERSYRSNQELITGLSHDLRTPLTKLMLYTEIVRSGKFEDDRQLSRYLGRIDDVAEQIRDLADNILRYSMAPSSQPEVACNQVALAEAFADELEEMSEYLSRQGFDVKQPTVVPSGQILTCASYVRRLFDNITSNIARYADESHPVFIEYVCTETHAGISIRNTVAGDFDDSEALGIGLGNIEAMMAAMGGHSQLGREETAFETMLWFLRGPGGR